MLPAAKTGFPPGGKSERRRESGKMIRRQFPQNRQRRRRAQNPTRFTHRGHASGEQIRQQGEDRQQRRTHRHQAPSNPSNRARQRDLDRPQEGRGRLDATALLHPHYNFLYGDEIPGEPAGQAIGQKAVGRVRPGAVIPGDPHPDRRNPGIGAVTMKTAATVGMGRTKFKDCVPPCFADNVFLAGEDRFVAKLHRPRPARWQPWRATSFWPQTTPLSRFTYRTPVPH